MEVFRSIKDIKEHLAQLKKAKHSIGFVPTMGALHEGHLSLVANAKQENSKVVVSIFVNPTQFNSEEDLLKYPNREEEDLRMLNGAGCNTVFIPTKEGVYPSGLNTYTTFSFGSIDQIMEGKHRKGHFNGVALVVSKLFHMIQPNTAYFGQKDLQQYLIIKSLVNDLSFPLVLRCCSTVREKSGLALSSRNLRLTNQERKIASNIYMQLTLAKNNILEKPETFKNPKSINTLKKGMINSLKQLEVSIEVEYIEFFDLEKMELCQIISKPTSVAICIAAFVNEVRLIDNLFIGDSIDSSKEDKN